MLIYMCHSITAKFAAGRLQPYSRGSRLAPAAMVVVSNIGCDADVGHIQGDTVSRLKRNFLNFQK